MYVYLNHTCSYTSIPFDEFHSFASKYSYGLSLHLLTEAMRHIQNLILKQTVRSKTAKFWLDFPFYIISTRCIRFLLAQKTFFFKMRQNEPNCEHLNEKNFSFGKQKTASISLLSVFWKRRKHSHELKGRMKQYRVIYCLLLF